MRLPAQGKHHVCLPCLVRYGRRTISSTSEQKPPRNATDSKATVPSNPLLVNLRNARGRSRNGKNQTAEKKATLSRQQLHGHGPGHNNERDSLWGSLNMYASGRGTIPSPSGKRGVHSTAANGSIELSPEQMSELQRLYRLKNRLQAGVSRIPPSDPTVRKGLSIEDALKSITPEKNSTNQQRLVRTLEQVYAGQEYEDVKHDLELVAPHRRSSRRIVNNSETKKVLNQLGVLIPPEAPPGQDQEKSAATGQASKSPGEDVEKDSTKAKTKRASPATAATKTKGRRKRGAVVRTVKSRVKTVKAPKTGSSPKLHEAEAGADSSQPARTKSGAGTIAKLDASLLEFVQARDHRLKPLAMDRPPVPSLSFDLSRVLFNPGVYQLQDPRSRVFNFSRYLAKPMPVSEFNYEALNKYITSSEDGLLRDIALNHRKRYIGSTSSMSGTLSHFHFLLSAWRELNLRHLTRGFRDEGNQFTRLSRGPNAIFLRWKDGVYAVDADREFDSANILMSLGKSMEKLLTLERDEFERYRKSSDAGKTVDEWQNQPEAYHYSELGQFLLRAQLDAHDPRLPGTGMFDLKTRAVAAVRMNIRDHEKGVGYQIKERFGSWESYEREYYDMMRSAFLKYSLQVRMGRMDGIFVAYHNIERIFGFQYVSLPELDFALHGQTDRTLGDQEFHLSLHLLNEVFNRATAAFPAQSLRLHFETREATASEPSPYMYIFVEPVTEKEAQRIQDLKKEEVAAFERRIFNPHQAEGGLGEGGPGEGGPGQGVAFAGDDIASADHAGDRGALTSESTDRDDRQGSAQTPTATASRVSSNAADVDFLDDITRMDLSEGNTAAPASSTSTTAGTSQRGPLLALKLVVCNRVNGIPVLRPQELGERDDWVVEYNMKPLGDDLAWRQYTLTKNRRKAALEMPQDQDAAVGYYLRRLNILSEQGAVWRQQQDELDAQRETIELYASNEGSAAGDDSQR